MVTLVTIASKMLLQLRHLVTIATLAISEVLRGQPKKKRGSCDTLYCAVNADWQMYFDYIKVTRNNEMVLPAFARLRWLISGVVDKVIMATWLLFVSVLRFMFSLSMQDGQQLQNLYRNIQLTERFQIIADGQQPFQWDDSVKFITCVSNVCSTARRYSD